MSNRQRHFGAGHATFGENTYGMDAKAFGDTTGKYAEWDASANQLNVIGAIAQTGNQVVTGTQQITGTLLVGGVQTLSTGQFIKGQRFTANYSQIAAADVAKTFFIAPIACKLVSAYERHVTVAGQAGTLTIEKLNTGEAPSAGDVMLASAWDLTSTANTPVSKAAVTDGKEIMVAGDCMCLKLASGAATSYALGTITCVLEAT